MPLSVSVAPITDVSGWRQFAEEISTGERREAHVEMLRRQGITREHVFRQPTPNGDLMVLVWEGVDQEEAAAVFGKMLEDPQSDHERYVVSHVAPNFHGIDPTAEPPPPVEHVSTIDTSSS
jgi:hypothetical protein